MAIELIEDFTMDINSFADYERDRKTQSAVESFPSFSGKN